MGSSSIQYIGLQLGIGLHRFFCCQSVVKECKYVMLLDATTARSTYKQYNNYIFKMEWMRMDIDLYAHV